MIVWYGGQHVEFIRVNELCWHRYEGPVWIGLAIYIRSAQIPVRQQLGGLERLHSTPSLAFDSLNPS